MFYIAVICTDRNDTNYVNFCHTKIGRCKIPYYITLHQVVLKRFQQLSASYISAANMAECQGCWESITLFAKQTAV